MKRVFADQFPLIPFYSFFLVLTVLSANHIFFWDTVQLASMHAHHFYLNNFSELLLPDSMDSGHIPVFGMYLAVIWKIAGKELWISHIAMLPFLFGIVWQTYRLIRHFIPSQNIFAAMILFLADPTLLAQSTLVSPDIVLIFFFLLALNSILLNQRVFLGVGMLGLFFISMRGIMSAFALFLFDLYFNVYRDKKLSLVYLLKMSKAYWPGFLLAFSYFALHYLQKGWFAFHPDSPWASSFERADFRQFIYNIGLLIWRIIDFGRVIWVLLIASILVWKFKRIKDDSKLSQIIVFTLFTLFCLAYSFTTYKYLSAHRYLMPFYALMSLLGIYVIFEIIKSKRSKYVLSGVVFVALLSGNFWIYPEGIAKGWDSSLAHWPYYELREKMSQFLDQSNIEYGQVASSFPNTSERRYMELTENQERHLYVNLDENEYVLYSNINNNFSDDELRRLKEEFVLIKTFEKRGVFVRLYKAKR